jgi:uncharacterized membrane protein
MKIKITASLLLLFLFANTSNGIILFHHTIWHRSYAGYIVTNSNDTVQGSIELKATKTAFSKTMVAVTKNNVTKYFDEKNVIYIWLKGADSGVTQDSYTEFNKIPGKDGLYRLLYKGNKKFYDNSSFVDENTGMLGDNILIIKDGKIIYDKTCFFSYTPKSYLLRFMNNKYHTKFKERDFKSIKDILVFFDSNY